MICKPESGFPVLVFQVHVFNSVTSAFPMTAMVVSVPMHRKTDATRDLIIYIATDRRHESDLIT